MMCFSSIQKWKLAKMQHLVPLSFTPTYTQSLLLVFKPLCEAPSQIYLKISQTLHSHHGAAKHDLHAKPCPPPVFVNTVQMARSHVPSCMEYPWLLLYNCRVEQQQLLGPQSLKYLQSCPLQKRFGTPYLTAWLGKRTIILFQKICFLLH